MADVTICKGSNREAFPISSDVGIIDDFDCPLKMTCYRYMASASEHWQSYFVGIPELKDGQCKYYIELRNVHHSAQ